MQYPFTLLALLFSIVAHSQSFTITGTVQGRDTGRLYLWYAKNDNFQVQDTVAIQNGQFQFSGELERPVQAYIAFTGVSSAAWLYLDPGHITLQAKADTMHGRGRVVDVLSFISIKGSRSDSLQKDIFGYWRTLKPDSSRPRLFYEKLYHFVAQNPDHNLGAEILRDADMFTYEQANNIARLFSPRIQSATIYKSIARLLQQLQRAGIGATYCFKAQPDTTGKLITGKELSYKYLLVDLWASWCGPCREEHPHLKTIYDQYKTQGLEILSVSLDDNRAAWLAAIKKDALPWPQVADLKGARENEIAQYYMVSSIPFNLLLDAQGKIVAHNLRGTQLDAQLATLLSTRNP